MKTITAALTALTLALTLTIGIVAHETVTDAAPAADAAGLWGCDDFPYGPVAVAACAHTAWFSSINAIQVIGICRHTSPNGSQNDYIRFGPWESRPYPYGSVVACNPGDWAISSAMATR